MRSFRVVWPPAALLGCALLASATVRAGEALNAWTDLWQTADQQGQVLLDAGEAAEAADRFHDPRRRAYADLEARRYQDAAKLLAPFTDPESEYNRGNALAESGQLPAALAAYDAALKQAPADKDIRHNRDLVERALRQQRQSAQSPSRNGRQGSEGAASSARQSPPSAGGQRSGSGSRQSGGSSQSSGALSRQSSGSSEAASSGAQPGNARPDSGSSKEGPGQAQHDAALAAAYAREQQKRASGHSAEARESQRNGQSEPGAMGTGKQPEAGSALAGGTETPKEKPETEQQLALDQWLRQIPDSPAGLLQRKFLIEHMMKQDNGNPEDRD
jgi:Ca-activated chloride channel homolog